MRLNCPPAVALTPDLAAVPGAAPEISGTRESHDPFKLEENHRPTSVSPPISESSRRIQRLPSEVGVLLMAAGMTTGMLPPPPGPFDLSIIITGGVVLWPRGFRAIDGWVSKRFPKAHRAGMLFLDRYLDDLERRYPDSTEFQSSSREMGRPDERG